jgi:hypothetical protein
MNDDEVYEESLPPPQFEQSGDYDAGEWSIDKSLIVHYQGWASLKSGWAQGHLPPVALRESEGGKDGSI